jgi:hypothetical protein
MPARYQPTVSRPEKAAFQLTHREKRSHCFLLKGSMMKSELLESTPAATHGCSVSGWVTADRRKAIVRGLIVASLALASGCAYDGPPGGYYGGGDGVFFEGDLADGRFRRAFHEDRPAGGFERGREGGFEGGHEGGGHEGGHEGGGHEGGGGHR